ncbi:DUF3078 domain-containing protein [Siansivirga zeaxanthinifaciens]|uniref:DUF3078 domain-containing protein n=1 Tax=Siansivirga zeaxanthinifaciens CC-SAMT-1 TaxID=1454006 RepID=A0A0C5W067_9FLAO|nr:DUF3078 domain-containing protein [Siansivirga zeaxanthinifaciens]AJR04666.1 hypothetical protein AW14_14500 [Siansivirga zeaxanthinifaciens CC-SAMT-1]
MKNLLLIVVCFFFQIGLAQPDSLFLKVKVKKYDGPQWEQKNKGSIYLSEVAFSNWNSGGSNSISGLLGIESSANYHDKYFSWKNNALLRFGVNRQQAQELRKTDDLLEINSNIGYKPDSISNWFYSARLNFRTQLLNGYKYPNKEEPISTLLAPGYLFFGGGMEYGKNIEKLSFYFSPLTLKATFVLDEDLANAGAFGVTPAVYDALGNIIVPGERIRKEVGVLVTNSYEMEVVENIDLKNQVSLYSDYINKFGNIDIDWSLDFNFKVNDFIKASLGSHIRYDNDVKTSKPTDVEGEFDEAGAKVQWKQFLGIGFAVDF